MPNVTSPRILLCCNLRSPTVCVRCCERVWSVARTLAGAVQLRQRAATSLEILIRNRPEQRRVHRQIAPTAAIEEPWRVVRIRRLDALLVLQGFPQVAATDF